MNTFIRVLLASILVLALGLLVSWFTADKILPVSDFPWKIENTDDGSIEVLHIHIGATTLGEFIQRHKAAPQISIFVPASGDSVVEAYFDWMMISEFKAKVILKLNVDQPTLQAMYNRGARISALEGGTRKVELSTDDITRMNTAVVSGVTYIPYMNLDVDLALNRFGEPEQKIKDQNTGAEHWMYPSLGLDMALSAENKEILQYVNPKDFNKLVAPLMQQQNLPSGQK
jgi:hypothetical protein